jgi:hypothetical protein
MLTEEQHGIYVLLKKHSRSLAAFYNLPKESVSVVRRSPVNMRNMRNDRASFDKINEDRISRLTQIVLIDRNNESM